MQVQREQISPTSVKLTIIADQKALDSTKKHVVDEMGVNVKVPGFRPGKAPANLIEKNIDPAAFQSEFLDHAINQLFVAAVDNQKLRPVASPKIDLTKFVPYTTLEFTAELDIVGNVILADYKKIKLAQKKVEVTALDVTDVIDNLRQRGAIKEEVKRAAKDGDEVLIDFKGTDSKTGEPIDGADGNDYPLDLGSKSFIPGFEEELIGLMPEGEKTFEIKFPADYGAAVLQNKKVNFAVTVHSVSELKPAKLDDDFAASVGPFKTVAELKSDIKKQLQAEKQAEASRAYDNELLDKIAAKSTVAIPPALINEEIDRMEEEEKRNIVYRGQTWQEHLDEEGIDAEQHHEKQRPGAEVRVKAGLILGEISEAEKITVTPEELEIRIQLLKGQYTDQATLAELDKPENRRDIMSRLLTEKTLDKLRAYAGK